ncbi:hypothetical protein EI77_03241 [Prosthecobacter fusiformis]|uniref:Uncharacterized protein n=2 Tax=Prosthecobacter fusiformis TaxID=48464 RepID=A0A4R7RRB0_9BACT|nr:hypothetical protein EI77_03241 [Prosthecobacter fusiformis]
MTISNSPILGRMLRPLAQTLRTELLEAVVELKPSSGDEERYHELADKNAEGTLTVEERKELEGIVAANTVLSLLRKEARETLSQR